MCCRPGAAGKEYELDSSPLASSSDSESESSSSSSSEEAAEPMDYDQVRFILDGPRSHSTMLI